MQEKFTPEERFWTKVNKTETCWLWTASTNGNGYSQFWIAGKRVLIHRYAYELLVGPIPDGLQLDHLCRVRHCVNPAHLEPVTGRVNTLRGETPAAANLAKTYCPAGHPYDAGNTRIWRGHRICRACNNVRSRAWKRKKASQSLTMT